MQHDVAEAVRDQLDAAQDERPHQDLAQLGVGLHQRQQLLARRARSPRRLARPAPRNSARRPEIMLTSPVNWPGRVDDDRGSRRDRDGRTISTSPAVTTKNGTTCVAALDSISPARMRADASVRGDRARSAPASASETRGRCATRGRAVRTAASVMVLIPAVTSRTPTSKLTKHTPDSSRKAVAW